MPFSSDTGRLACVKAAKARIRYVCQSCGSAQHRWLGKCPDCGSAMNEEQAGQAIRFPSLDESQKRLDYLYTTRKRLDEFLGSAATGVGEIVRSDEIEALRPRFDEAMNDDFNAAAAVGVLADAMRLSNEVLDNKEGHPEAMITSTVQVLENLLDYMSSVVGVLERDAQQALHCLQSRAVQSACIDAGQIDQLIVERNQARAAKDFARADQIRDQITEMGVELMDGPQGTTWKICG